MADRSGPDDHLQYYCPVHGVVFADPRNPLCPNCNRYLGRPSHILNLGIDESVRKHQAYHAPNLPAPKSAIERLQELEITQDMLERQNECVICTEKFQLGDTVKVLECGHFFHAHCIVPWLEQHKNQCPICRATLYQPLKVPPWGTDHRDRGSSSGSSSCA